MVKIGGKAYSHVLDPRAGLGVTEGWLAVQKLERYARIFRRDKIYFPGAHHTTLR